MAAIRAPRPDIRLRFEARTLVADSRRFRASVFNRNRHELAPSMRLTLSSRRYLLTRKVNTMVATAHDLLASGYVFEVDGRHQAEFATRDGATTGAEESKKRFPMLR